MNVPTRWTEDKIGDDEVVFRSEHTFGGKREVRCRRVNTEDGPILVWTNQDDAPHAIIERAHKVLNWA